MKKEVTIAIGDVHGRLDKLQNLINHCEADFPQYINNPTTIKWVFIGDYIDRGPDSKGVIDYVRKMKNATTLVGNHETMLLEAIDGASPWLKASWTSQYGQTLSSFNATDLSQVPIDYINWMRSLPYYYNDGVRTFVHAGIEREFPLSAQNKSYMTWARHEFMNDTRSDGGFVVHGHTPLPSGLPDLHDNRINIDTAAVYGGRLTAVIFVGTLIKPTRFIQDTGFRGNFAGG